MIHKQVLINKELDSRKVRQELETRKDYLNQKVERLIDKYAATVKENELRAKKLVRRSPVGTTYYIDLDNGNDSNDGLSTSSPWLTIEKYTSVTSRSPGDIAKVRANTTEVFSAGFGCDEDGNMDDLITVKGCDSTDDPWGDASDIKPILDFNGGSYGWDFSSDGYWKLDNLEVHDSHNNAIYLYNLSGWYARNCTFSENSKAVYMYAYCNYISIEDCEFTANTNGIYSSSSNYLLYPVRNCIFNGAGTRGLYYRDQVVPLILEDCSFGVTTAFTDEDVYIFNGGIAHFRNCIFTTGIATSSVVGQNKAYYFEDAGGVFEEHKVMRYFFDIERNTSVLRTGGADSSLKLTLNNSGISINRPIYLSGPLPQGLFKIWLNASVEKTITVYIRGYGWTSFPTASELYLQALYLSSASNADRTLVKSTQVLSDNTTWVGFQVTMTPARDGFVYLDLVLCEYEADSGIYIDIKPVVS